MGQENWPLDIMGWFDPRKELEASKEGPLIRLVAWMSQCDCGNNSFFLLGSEYLNLIF